MIYSDESPYLLFPHGNSKNDIVWAKDGQDVVPREVVKFSPKIMVWGAISATSLSELHIVPQNTSVTADYYTENILTNNLLLMFNTGSNCWKKFALSKVGNAFYARRSLCTHCNCDN